MTTVMESVLLHEAQRGEATVAGDPVPVLLVLPCPSLPMLTFEGVTSDGRRCQAVTAKRERCPKPGAVALLVEGHQPQHVCGTHFGGHRRAAERGDRCQQLVLVPEVPR